MPEITIYTSTGCPYCLRAKNLLDNKGVEYTEHNLSKNPELSAECRERSKGGKTVPQIFIGDLHVGGCDDLHAMEKEGRLDPLLGG